jgi:hypothetical protein
MTTATETVFRAKDPWLRLVRVPKGMTDAHGNPIYDAPEPITYEFHDGNFTSSDLERVHKGDPEAVAVAIEWFRNHRGYNVDFFEVGNEPDRPKPEPEERIADITEAALQGDLDRVRQELAAEQETHNRPVVMEAGRRVLDLAGQAEGAEAETSGEPDSDESGIDT